MQVVNLSTPAQLFHCLRQQIRRDFRKPLVVMSPKSLLRHPLAVSRTDELTAGSFRRLIDDPGVKGGDRERVRRVLLCSGRIYYRLLEDREQRGLAPVDAPILRLEQLY